MIEQQYNYNVAAVSQFFVAVEKACVQKEIGTEAIPSVAVGGRF